MSNKHMQWLYGQLPLLVEKRILTQEAADRLREHFGPVGMSSGKRLAIVLFGVLGGLLLAGGIILLFAHNWAHLSRPARVGLSFAPLILSQALGAWVVAKRCHSMAWREGVGGALMLSIGACIALIAQTYHMPGAFDQFLLVWMILAVPVIYFLHAATPAVLYLAGITVWAGTVQYTTRHALGYYPLLALVAPFVWMVNRRGMERGAAALLRWALTISLGAAIGITLEKALPGLWIPIYAAFFAVLYLVGSFWFSSMPTLWQRPFFMVGGAGIPVLSLLLTYQWPWKEIGWHHYRVQWRYHEPASLFDYVLLGVTVVGAVTLLAMTVRRRLLFDIAWGLAPIVAILSYGTASVSEEYLVPALLFNGYLFGLGLVTMIHGIRTEQLSRLNVGMLLLAGVILARFFDEKFGMLTRGVVFVALGSGFLITNLVMLRRKGGVL